jgi:glutamate N-acetyltransferase/amino-acid N-acetyltransferase
MCDLAAQRLGIAPELVLVGSTGVIGRGLPLDKIAAAVPSLTPARSGGVDFARAIMTTDTVPKSRAVRVTQGNCSYSIGGVAKGSGMVHPDMATVFGFFTTDANIPHERLQVLLRQAADVSFNMIDVDMDTSTSDTMLLFANAAAGGGEIGAGSPDEALFAKALTALAIELARDLAREARAPRP